ncbi:MAG TPA: 1,4-alpha-glucan branching protein GlgB [Solirubrobacterales bacterium]
MTATDSTLHAEVERLVHREHHDPHSLLGVHRSNGGAVVRAYRPAAAKVVARPDGGEAVELRQTHPAGLFEAAFDAGTPPGGYELEVTYPDGGPYAMRDPYAFPPTLGEVDLHLIGEGRHEELYGKLGAHVTEVVGVAGTAFAVWAPGARAVSVVGAFNDWRGDLDQMRSLGASGIWEIFIPGVAEGTPYKFEIITGGGEQRLKADPLAFATTVPPQTDSVVHRSRHRWSDAEWLERRRQSEPSEGPVSIYEVHLGSWRRLAEEGGRSLSYRELADELAAYVAEMGFTHVELLPVMEHPFGGSWGYQVTSQFAPSARYGSPDDFRAFVDKLHGAGIGVILDWVPAHFPRDDWALARFDGTALYEHSDPRRGAHPEWGTLIYNYGRHEVRNFLTASALFWPREYHADGIRVDAVASMLYLDYSRPEGAWVPNEFGGNEDLEAVEFLKGMNETLYRRQPGIVSAAEESTAWPGVSRPTYVGGLGFGFKWNMGWMHDTLEYFSLDPVYRSYHHHGLTFSLMYAFSENFILPLSHDEVVHGKGSMYGKMAGDRWQKLANLRALYAYMWAHPGKKLLFMGNEIAQEQEWSYERSLDWHLLERPEHAGIQSLVRDLNTLLRSEPALYERDFDPSGFYWLEANDAARNVVAFARISAGGERTVVCVANLSPMPRQGYRVGLPRGGCWVELLNTDSRHYGGGDVGNGGGVEAEPIGWHDQRFSAELTLPPLGVLWLRPESQAGARR